MGGVAQRQDPWLDQMESLHPLIVHFPVALLLTAVVLEIVALLMKRPALHRVALWNVCLGTLGAAAAVATGLQAQAIGHHTFEIYEVMEVHERLGITTLTLGSVVAGWRLLARDRLGPRQRWLALALMLVMACTVSYGAYLGGRLVYEFGVGGTFGR